MKKDKKSVDKATEPQKRRGIFSSSGKRIKPVHTLRYRFSFTLFILFAITGVTTALLFILLLYILRITTPFFEDPYLSGILLVVATAISCIIIGTVISSASTKIWLGRLTRISNAMREIAKGNFKTRVPEKDKKETLTEFGELERAFNQMSSDLDGIEMFRNDFINNFSHEFKTPIVSIRGFARQLQSESLTEEQKKEYINIIVEESSRLAGMAQNVLLLTKLENQTIVSEKTEFYLDEQLRHVILLFEKEWSEKNIELDLDMDEVKYTFNEEMLSHVWINILSNAVKFTPENGRISCKLKQSGRLISVEISDSGMGMSDEVKARIFEKFYQGDSSHATIGNGIGLNIVSRIVDLAGGSISVESAVGKGSSFTVKLPTV